MIAAEYVLYVLYVCTIDQSVSATCLMRKTLFQYISRQTNKNSKYVGELAWTFEGPHLSPLTSSAALTVTVTYDLPCHL